MSYLRQLSVEAEDLTDREDRFRLRQSSYHVVELLLLFLPRSTYIDGSSKFRLVLCPGQRDAEVFSVLGVTDFYVSNFDFTAYFALSPETQEEHILDLLCSSLARCCEPGSDAMTALPAAGDKIRSAGFSWRYEIEKLRKTSRSQKVRVRVFRGLSRETKECWEAVVERAGMVLTSVVMGNPGTLVQTDIFKEAHIEGDCYVVQDIYGKASFSINLHNLV